MQGSSAIASVRRARWGRVRSKSRRRDRCGILRVPMIAERVVSTMLCSPCETCDRPGVDSEEYLASFAEFYACGINSCKALSDADRAEAEVCKQGGACGAWSSAKLNYRAPLNRIAVCGSKYSPPGSLPTQRGRRGLREAGGRCKSNAAAMHPQTPMMVRLSPSPNMQTAK